MTCGSSCGNIISRIEKTVFTVHCAYCGCARVSCCAVYGSTVGMIRAAGLLIFRRT